MRNKIIILLGLLVLVGAGCVKVQYPADKQSEKTPDTASAVPAEAKFDPASYGNPHPKTAVAPDALAAHNVVRAVSDDGVNWQADEEPVIRKGSVPAAILKDDGTYIVYYVSGVFDSFDCSSSTDGVNFSPANCTIYGFTERHAWDPYVVRLADGSYRLYFVSPQVGWTKIMSARSEDGINWLQEEGERFVKSGVFLVDPAVAKIGSTWYMYMLSDLENGPAIIVATSEDGITFKEKTVLRPGGHITEVAQLESGKYEGFTCGGGSMITIFSTDGLVWGERAKPFAVAHPYGCDPSIVRTKDGKWIMYYKNTPKE